MGSARHRLSDRKMVNRRFRRTEDAIIRALLGNDAFVSAGEMARRAGVARSTFYRHHSAVGMIIPDYREYILAKYSRMLRRLLSAKAPLKYLYLRTLFFIRKHKDTFFILIRSGETETILRIINYLRPRIERFAHLPKNSERIFIVYRGEIRELIFLWCKSGMPEKDIETLVTQIMYLTETMRMRLAPLTD